MIIHEIIYYIGLVLLLGGFIANIVFLYLIKKYEKKYTSLIDILKNPPATIFSRSDVE